MLKSPLNVSVTELNSGEYIGLGALEITAIPSISILTDSESNIDYISSYKKEFSKLLSELYQNFRMKADYYGAAGLDVSLELLWVTEAAKNQPYNADIKLFLIYRNINTDENEVVKNLSEIESICISALNLQKYEYRTVAYEDLYSKLSKIDTSGIRAVVKDERIENLQNNILGYCYAFDTFPQTGQDMSKIVNALINFPNCAVSFQLMFTRYSFDEVSSIERMSTLLDNLTRGIQDQMIGNVSFAVAEKHAETYKYYERNKNAALFTYNILIYGSREAATNLSSRVYNHINGGGNQVSPSTKYINLSADTVGLLNNFYPLPWAINEYLIYNHRNDGIWGQTSEFKSFFRLPYIITADEASEFFRLPIGSKTVSAGLKVNESSKDGRSYTSGIINGGDITVGKLKSSTNESTIGFFLKDLTKHMLIVGTPGSGKTTFTVGLLDRLWKEHNIPFLIIEPAKNEYRALIQSIPDIQVFTPGKNFISPFIFNPFVPPKNVILESYKSTLKTAFAAGVAMSSPLDKIFEEAVNNCYSDFRWLDTYTSDDKGRIFNISDFIKCFQETFENIGYTGEAKNIGRAGYVRLNSLVSLFDNYSTVPVEDLLSKPTIIELAAIENSDQKALIIALLLLSILSYVNRNYIGDGTLRNVICLEEAHVLLDSESHAGEGEADPAAVAKGLLKRMLAEIRSYGVGIVIADQSPRKVSSDVVGLTNIKLVFRLVEAVDKEIIANSTNMSDVQVQRVAKLRPGEAFLFFDKLDEPEEVKIEDYRLKNKIDITLSDESIRELTTYWKERPEMLKPYPECNMIKFCPNTCNFSTRILARDIARRIFARNFKPDTKDFEVLKDVYFRIERLIKAELNDEPYTKELSACVKLQLLRRVKYYTRIPLTDKIITETLKKI